MVSKELMRRDILNIEFLNMLTRQTTSAKLSSLSWTRTMQQANTARPHRRQTQERELGPGKGCGTVDGLPGAANLRPARMTKMETARSCPLVVSVLSAPLRFGS